MVQYTKVDGKMIANKVMEFIIGLMEKFMKDNGIIIKLMVKDVWSGQTEEYIKASLKMISKKAMEFINGFY